MKISQREQQAISTVCKYGKEFGYGNLMSHLRTAWAREMVVLGYADTEQKARGMTHCSANCMPFEMQEDIILSGEWDETGEKYK